MTRMLSVAETRWNFYECIEAGDLENASAYFETLFHHYQNRGKRIKSLLKNSINVEQLIKWIQSRQIDGTMCIAKTDFLKGQKNGEMMMLRKMYDAITSTSHNTD